MSFLQPFWLFVALGELFDDGFINSHKENKSYREGHYLGDGEGEPYKVELSELCKEICHRNKYNKLTGDGNYH